MSSLALLTACGGGGSGTQDAETNAEKMTVANSAVWNSQAGVTSITLSRADNLAVAAGTNVIVSSWTCESSDPQGLNEPLATDEVARKVVSEAGTSVTLTDVSVPATQLLVQVTSGTSTYYAKRHNMVTAGNSAGNLAIVLDVAPDTEEKMALQFDKCP
jgi:hypothetical protein